MVLSETHRIVQALLFSASEPLTDSQVEVCLQEKVPLVDIVSDINRFYDQEQLPIWVQKVADGYRLMSRKQYDPWISRLYQNKGQVKLTRSALETLAIIAYKQPVTKSEIDAIRGVNTYLKSLLEKNLIETRGREEGPGRPLLYGTTAYFLEYFGLNSLKDLPQLKEIEELISDDTEGEDQGNSSE